jgi:hypothetical protein
MGRHLPIVQHLRLNSSPLSIEAAERISELYEALEAHVRFFRDKEGDPTKLPAMATAALAKARGEP